MQGPCGGEEGTQEKRDGGGRYYWGRVEMMEVLGLGREEGGGTERDEWIMNRVGRQREFCWLGNHLRNKRMLSEH